MMKRIVYQVIIAALLSALVISPHAQAQTPRYLSAAELLPVNTLLYVEVQGSKLPASLDDLTGAFLPGDFSLQDAFADVPDWLGDHIAASVFLPVDMQNPRPADYVPTGVLMFQIGDESAADDFFKAQLDAGHLESVTASDGNRYRPSMLPELQILHVPGFLVVGTSRGLDYISHIPDSRTETLVSSGTFHTVQNTLAPEPLVWIYSPLTRGGVGLYAENAKISLETVRIGDEPARVAAALSPDALQAVPVGAWFVDAAMNADIGMQTALDNIRRLGGILAPLNENLQNLPVMLEDIPRTLAGVSLTNDILPLFDGGYAAYVMPTIAGNRLDAGLILAPHQTSDVPFILTRVSNRIAQTTGLDVELSGQTQYTIHTDSNVVPDVVYGLADERLYIGTEGGAARSLIALEDGQNINRDTRWLRALESAPEGAQRVTYINLRDMIDTARVVMADSQTPNSEFLQAVMDYLTRFESLAIFSRQDADGVQLTRVVLLLGQ